MSELVFMNPADEDRHKADGEQAADGNEGKRKRRRRTDPGALPSRDDCLRRLNLLPGLIATGVIRPAEGGVMRAVYQTILNELRHTPGGQAGQLSDDAYLKVLHERPDLLALLEPFMTDEQIEILVRKASDNDEPQT